MELATLFETIGSVGFPCAFLVFVFVKLLDYIEKRETQNTSTLNALTQVIQQNTETLVSLKEIITRMEKEKRNDD